MMVGSRCLSKTFQLQICRDIIMIHRILCIVTPETAEFCTLNDTAICPQNGGCIEVEERPFIVSPK